MYGSGLDLREKDERDGNVVRITWIFELCSKWRRMLPFIYSF